MSEENKDAAAASPQANVNPTPQNTPAGVAFNVPAGEGAGEGENAGEAGGLSALSSMFGNMFSGMDPGQLQAMLAAGGGITSSGQFLGALPKHIQRRAYALENLHAKVQELWLDEQAESNALIRKYEQKYNELFEKRRQIVNGEHEPSDEEAAKPDWIDSDDEGEDGPKVEEVKEDEDSDDEGEEEGIPEFWLQVIQDDQTVSQLLGEADGEALLYLEDISAETQDTERGKRAFTLTFKFGENEFFKNKTLSKTYHLELNMLEGQVLKKIEADTIEWHTGKDLTTKVIKKKQRNKKGQVRTVNSNVKQESFFNFFNSVDLEDEEDENKLMAAQEDYELAEELYENIVPAAVKYWTGEAQEAAGQQFGGPHGETDSEDDSEDDGDDGEEGGEGGDGKPECKQS